MANHEQHELVTVAQAAEILGMSESGTFRLLDRGALTRRGNARGRKDSLGVVRRADVEQLANDRARAVAEREQRQATTAPAPPSRRPDPVDGHRWLTPIEAAEVIGITPQAIRLRCRRGTIPHLARDGRWFIREDHARLAAHVRATDGPEAVSIALDGLR